MFGETRRRKQTLFAAKIAFVHHTCIRGVPLYPVGVNLSHFDPRDKDMPIVTAAVSNRTERYRP